MRFIGKLLLKIASFIYPKIDELLLEKFLLILFPGRNFHTLVGDNVFDKQIVFKVLKDRFGKPAGYYVIAVYDYPENIIRIQAIRKGEIESKDFISKKLFYDIVE